MRCIQCGAHRILDDKGLCVICFDGRIDSEDDPCLCQACFDDPFNKPDRIPWHGEVAAAKNYYQLHRARILAKQQVYDALNRGRRKAYDRAHRSELTAYRREYNKRARDLALTSARG